MKIKMSGAGSSVPNPKAWEFFQGQAPWYRRKASWWVMSAKAEKTRESRLERLILESEKGARI